MLSKISTASLIGLDCYEVEVETDIGLGLPAFNLVGLADTAILESRERVRSAIKNSGFSFPSHRITVNLAPANIKKDGAHFDLPIAIGVLAASEYIPTQSVKRLFYGELSLDGKLRSTRGVLPIALEAKKHGFTELFIPLANAKEAALAASNTIQVYEVSNLAKLVKTLRGEEELTPVAPVDCKKLLMREVDTDADFSYVKGQSQAKRALEIAAAGAHNLSMTGPPGAGKTLLARSLPTILPALTVQEALEITKLYSIAGLLSPGEAIIRLRPFRSPHHTASAVAIIGGGTNPHPGEISLAHRGVLFMDELPEFPKSVLEVLRQPLEDRVVTVSRAAGSLQFPANFMFIAAANPCPCGNLGTADAQCLCSPSQIMRYQKKVSGPLLDRIDLHLSVPKVNYEELTDDQPAEDSATIRQRVEQARLRQYSRFENTNILTNSGMRNQDIKKYCSFAPGAVDFLKTVLQKYRLSARSFYRLIKVAQTIADLDSSQEITVAHIAEGCQYRSEEKMIG